jgi:hypothetical protein
LHVRSSRLDCRPLQRFAADSGGRRGHCWPPARPRRRGGRLTFGEHGRRVVRAYWLARGRAPFGCSRPDSRLAVPARLPLLPGVASPPVSGHGVHVGAVPAALTRPVSKRGRAGGRPSSPARVDSPPRRIHVGQIDPGRLSCGTDRIPSAYAGRAVPSGGAARPDHPAPAFSASHDTQAVVASPLRFSCLAPRVKVTFTYVCAPFIAQNKLRRRPCGSFVAGVLPQHAFRARTRAVLAAWPGGLSFAAPATPVGFAATLRSVVPTPRVSAPRRRLGPTCRFAWRSTASSIDAGRRFLGRVGGSPGRGSWALAPGVSRAVRAGDPAMALGEQGRPGAPAGTALGFDVLSQVFGRRPLTPASGGRPPVGFAPRAVAT